MSAASAATLLAAAAAAITVMLSSCFPSPGVASSEPPVPVRSAPGDGPVVVDDFEDITGWSAHPADGVKLEVRSGDGFRGRALRLDFGFTGGGYAVARKDVAITLPENYAISFRVRGDAPPNHLEFKMIDATGENVWWSVRRDVSFPVDWTTFTIKKRHVTFAWGPIGGGEIRDVAAIELAITAGRGGTGTVWIDELELRPLAPPGKAPPPVVARATSSLVGQDAANLVDGDPATSWSPAAGDATPEVTLDLGPGREFGGLVVDWAPGRHVADYDVDISDDAATWRTLRAVRGGNGGRDYLFLPEAEGRWVRVRLLEVAGFRPWALAEVAVRPLEWASSREAFFESIARDSPRGTFPRGITGEQTFWTVVGVDADRREVLFSQDGAIETGKARFSVEPFLFVNGELVTWDGVDIERSLANGALPIPSVTWTGRAPGGGLSDGGGRGLAGLSLEITAFGTGEPGASSIVTRYRLRNRGRGPVTGTLFLALRPFQVNPPSQSLNVAGGCAPIPEIFRDGTVVRVPGQGRVVSLTPPNGFGAVSFDGGDVVADYLGRGQLPPSARVADSFGAASGALAYSWKLAPGAEEEIDIFLPLYDDSPLPDLGRSSGASGTANAENAADAAEWAEREQSLVADAWRARTERVSIEVPPSAAWIAETIRSQLAYILINRAGPAIQPGTRSYARSWIRDGALTSWALLQLGHADAAREFLEWYAPHQYDNGKIPCVVDDRGADPVPEHDSSGELIFLVAEIYRHTKDRELAERMWPRVLAAVSYLDALRQERRTEEWREPGREAFFGILPPSISHEGYSAKPMHSYWDDFFALRGFRDAVFLAGELGSAERPRLERIHREFRADLAASIRAAMRMHGIDWVPGAADLGDFDATSTTVALSPAAARDVAGRAAIERTFEKYWEFFRARRAGEPWEAYTPYEIRNVGAFVRLGWRDRAHELLEFFRGHQRPPGWRQWAEVVRHDEITPHFIGDLPHTWVGSDFVRSALDLFAWEREEDDALVLAAGIARDWLPGKGVAVDGLRTRHGPVGFSIREREGAIVMDIDDGLAVPRGGIVVRAPVEDPSEVTVNGSRVAQETVGEIVVRQLPATIVWKP